MGSSSCTGGRSVAESRSILFRLLGDSRGLERATKAGQSSLEKLRGSFGRVASIAGVGFGAAAATKWVGDALSLASAAEEVDSKFSAVFGSAEELEAALSALGDKAGITDSDIKGLAATFGNLASSQGIVGDELSELTLEIGGLAGDLASFNDSNPDEVFANLTKAILTTEREGLKSLGIAVSEAEVKQRALARATEEGRTEVTKADRAWASYAIVVEQSGKAIGDLDRTSDSAANMQRQLSASIEELQTEIGRELLPVFRDLLEIANELSPVLTSVAGGVGDLIRPIADMTSAVNDANEEGKRWYETLGDATVAAYRLIPGVSAAIDGIGELVSGTDDAAVSFAEFGSASPYIEAALDRQRSKWDDAAEGARLTAEATEEAERRVASAVDRWVRVLGDLQSAYDQTKRKAEAAAFLAPGGGDDRGADPYGPGGEFSDFGDAQTQYERVNGPG